MKSWQKKLEWTLIGVGLSTATTIFIDSLIGKAAGQVPYAQSVEKGLNLKLAVIPGQRKVGHAQTIQAILYKNNQPLKNAAIQFKTGNKTKTIKTNKQGKASMDFIAHQAGSVDISVQYKGLTDMVTAYWN